MGECDGVGAVHREVAVSCGYRRSPRECIPGGYDRALSKKRNEIERLFRRLKGFRRIFSRFEKPDVIFLAFLCFAFIIEAPRLV